MGPGAFGAVQQREAGVSEYAGEKVVEIMGDAPGQDPEAFQFLHLQKLGFHALAFFFGLPFFGDIEKKRREPARGGLVSGHFIIAVQGR